MQGTRELPQGRRRYKFAIWLVLAACLITSFLILFIPFWWIHPFHPQTPTRLAIAYMLRHWAPVLCAVALLVCIMAVIFLWSRSRLLGRIVSLFCAALAILTAWFAQQNYFEWFFHPLAHPGYARAAEMHFLADSDMVLSVEINGDAVAYPVRLLGYHHMVNDLVGGNRVVATY